jgi:hypothetical protein
VGPWLPGSRARRARLPPPAEEEEEEEEDEGGEQRRLLELVVDSFRPT